MDLERWMCSPPTKTGGWPPSEGGCNETTANTGKPVFVLFSSLSLHHRCLHFTVTITSENSNLKPSSLLSKVVPDALPAPCLYPALTLVLPPAVAGPSSPRSSCCVTSCVASPHWTPGAGGRVPRVPPGPVALHGDAAPPRLPGAPARS